MNARQPAAMKTSLRHRFYFAVVFLYAVTRACENNRQPIPSDLSWHQDSSLDQTYKDFVNRLCQFCDVKLGGDSVTAFTVLDLQNHIQYRFACNRRNKTQLTRARDFVKALLGILQGVIATDVDIRSHLLSMVFGFCRVRVQTYLRALNNASIACMGAESVETTLLDQLRKLQTASKYADIASLNDAACKSILLVLDLLVTSKILIQVQVAVRMETLIASIDSIKDSSHSVFRERAAQSNMNQSSSCWSELRHYAGRILSFSHAVKTMVMAAKMFPRLFDDPEVIFVDSSNPDVNPIQKAITLEKILRTMTANSSTAVHYQSLIQDARAMNLDSTVQSLVRAETFRPIVHAELLVLQSLERADLTHPSNFFNSWKYIGSSKPTCKLCDYYFRAHNAGFQVRPTHGNPYINWKPPDVYRAYPYSLYVGDSS